MQHNSVSVLIKGLFGVASAFVGVALFFWGFAKGVGTFIFGIDLNWWILPFGVDILVGVVLVVSSYAIMFNLDSKPKQKGNSHVGK